jgi:protein SCO1/2
MLKTVRYAAFALIAVLAIAWGIVWVRGGSLAQLGLDNLGVSVPGGVSVGGPFTLVDTTGATVTDATYRGRWMLVYFGYTYCPDVCPTELQTISAALDQIGPLAAKVVPILITIDPERDTRAALAEYVKLFDDRLVGLTGTAEQVAAAARAYRVYYARAKSKDSSAYLMDHSAFVYLIGPDGGFRALFRQGVTTQDLADALKSRMSAGG